MTRDEQMWSELDGPAAFKGALTLIAVFVVFVVFVVLLLHFAIWYGRCCTHGQLTGRPLSSVSLENEHPVHLQQPMGQLRGT